MNANDFFDLLSENPERFLALLKKLGIELWDAQKEVYRAAFKYPEVYVRTANATGKTFLSGVLGVAFLFCYRPSKVIYIATKIEQSQRQSWMEFLRIYWKVRQFLSEVRDGPLVLPEPLAHKLNLGDDWFATVWGGSHADPEAYHGFHGRDMLIIIDEASGIDDEIRIAVDRCLTGKNNHLVALGNPLRRVGWFYTDQQKDAKHRKVIHISALDSPNVVAGREVVPGLVTAEKIKQRREEYGENSAFWQSAVLGEFPQEASGALIPWDAIDAARVRHIEPDYERLSIGVDVARYGSDQSVIVVLAGDSVAEISELSKHDTMSVAGWVKDCLRRWRTKTVAVDEPGLGAGVIDRLREEGINVMAWQPGGAPRRKELYLNAKAEAAADLRERFVRNGIAIPDHHRLTQELAAWTYEFMGDGRMKVIDPRKSPDYADALLIAHWAQGPTTLKEKIVSGGETYTAKLAW